MTTLRRWRPSGRPWRARLWTSLAASSVRFVLYGSLGLLFSVSVLLEVLGHTLEWSWVDVWMPNFIAEWSGIFIAVFVVDRLLEIDRQLSNEERFMGLRHTAAHALDDALAPLMACMILACGREPSNTVASINEYYDGEIEVVADEADLRWISNWHKVWADAATATRQRLDRFRTDYAMLIEPDEIRRLDHLREAVRRATTAFGSRESLRRESEQVAPDIGRITPLRRRLAQGRGILAAEDEGVPLFGSLRVLRHRLSVVDDE
jgi:hypothetical protein